MGAHSQPEGSVRVACAAAGVNYGSTQPALRGHLCCCRSELWEHTASLERSVRVTCAAAGVNYAWEP